MKHGAKEEKLLHVSRNFRSLFFSASSEALSTSIKIRGVSVSVWCNMSTSPAVATIDGQHVNTFGGTNEEPWLKVRTFSRVQLVAGKCLHMIPANSVQNDVYATDSPSGEDISRQYWSGTQSFQFFSFISG